MQKDFWIERWQQQQIGFHQAEINRYLLKYWDTVRQKNHNAKVFVPLCGKSTDMLWLQQQGHPVFGVEFSEVAINDFFDENKLAPEKTKQENFEVYKTENLNILCGDFFHLQQDEVKDCQLVYDRASLVALPEALRSNYADHLTRILPETVRILLITMEYPQTEMQGPPFSVSENEVNQLFGDNFQISKLETFDIYQENPRFQERGLTSLLEKVFLLVRN